MNILTNMKELTDQEYQYIYSRVPRICVDLFITTGTNFILEKRDTEPFMGMWGLVGGGVKFNETLEEAIQRHALDGLGASVLVEKFLGVEEYLGTDGWRHSISLNYLVKPTEKILNLKAQAFHSIPENTLPTHAKLLKKWEIV